MSAVQLLAAAVLALAVGALAGAIVIIGLVRRVRALEAESPSAAQVRFARAILEDRLTHQPRPATSHVNERTTPPTTVPSAPAPGSGRGGAWNGQGWQA